MSWPRTFDVPVALPDGRELDGLWSDEHVGCR
jgi:hypothetical protein